MPPSSTTWRHRLRRLLRPAWLGTLRRTTPLSRHWGADRGTPVDRYYIERFLEAHRSDIRGRVLEVKDGEYARRFGREVTGVDVLDIYPANPEATVIVDLTSADAVPGNSYDCFILTQTLQFILEPRAALAHVWRVLRPGGVLLATVPTVSRVIREFDYLQDHWRFTPSACTILFAERFGPAQIDVRGRGNVLVSIAFLAGLAAEELSGDELERDDPDFPLLVTIRAVKSGSAL
ncbi:MAG TPA: methyltransferase domain-containing protein [Gemmatimonadales bacterium]|nr:methyltransferase domain-containing protein [Gemmatimonadales bacterium]